MRKEVELILKVLKYIFLGFFGIWILVSLFFQRILGTASLPMQKYQKINNTVGQKIYLKDKDGKYINALYINNNSDKVIYYFHGNGGNLNMFEGYMKYFASLGYNVLCFDYPGYGESEGFPYEHKIYEISQLYLNYLTNTKEYSLGDIIVVGYSIGSVPAVDLAWKNEVNSLIIFSGLTDSYGMSKKLFGFNIIKLFMKPNSYNSLEKISEISIPTLIFHGDQDNVIPYEMGIKLYENSISVNKYFVNLEGLGHNGYLYTNGKQIGNTMKKFIQKNYNKM
ncbi:MAG: alpha/beta hydrolase [Candidatus Absconditabacteria bacterium]